MAAPSAGSRSTPVGIKLINGHPSKAAIAADPDISFWEVTVKPPAIEGGDPIDITDMFNSVWRTKAPRNLLDMGPINLTASYDPAVYTQIQAVVNVETTITVIFPDGSTLAAYGFLRSADPENLEEGAQPRMSIVIEVTNYDHANYVEASPVLTSVAGT